MEAAQGDPGLQCWFINKPYLDMYLTRGRAHRARALELGFCQRKAVRNQIPGGQHILEMFAVSPTGRFPFYVSVLAFCRN